jgi:methanethiol S-methyltransferase
MVGRIAAFVYGVFCYVVFLGTFLYAVGFLGNFGVPKGIDSGRTAGFAEALLIDAALLGLFAVQHSLMARQWFKKAWTRLVPPSVERSTYVLFSSVALLVLFWKWEPIGGVIWSVENSAGRIALWMSYAAGWLIVLVATFLINHFDLFGLRQVWCKLTGREYQSPKFRTPGMYRYVRHPLYVGWLLVFWSTPEMTAAHLVFALATTGYILMAIQLEERDLMRAHAEYAEYRRRVPMLVPSASDRTRTQIRRPAANQAS